MKNKETWLVFYRTENDDLTSVEIETAETKESAIESAKGATGFKDYEYVTGKEGTTDGVIAKRLVYVKAKKKRIATA